MMNVVAQLLTATVLEWGRVFAPDWLLKEPRNNPEPSSFIRTISLHWLIILRKEDPRFFLQEVRRARLPGQRLRAPSLPVCLLIALSTSLQYPPPGSPSASLPPNHSLCTCNPWVRDDYTFLSRNWTESWALTPLKPLPSPTLITWKNPKQEPLIIGVHAQNEKQQ